MKTIDLTDAVLLASLRSTCCPACGGLKGRAKTFCFRDYGRLPQGMRHALYRQVRHGYREAVIGALQFLDVAEPAVPAAGNSFVAARGEFRA
jgi:hypothetical protein